MSELYGAPSGIIASDENIRRNILSGLTAAETLGKIEQQPAEKALKEAHARLYGAEAAVKEQEAAAKRQMLDLQAEFVARNAAVQQGAAQGREVTVADVPPGGFTQASQADPLRRFAAFARDRLPPLALAKVDLEIANITEKEAISAYRNAQAEKQKADLQKEKLGMMANAASSAATNPQSYMAVRGNPELSQLLPPGLSGDFATDKPILEAVAAAGQDAIKKAELAARQADDASKAKLRVSTAARNTAAISRATEQTRLAKARADQLIKNGGAGDPETVRARKILADKREAEMQARDRKEFPPVPLDPKARAFGQTYTAADGKTRFVWEKDPATGQGVARRLAAPAPARAAAASTGKEEASDTGADDETEED